MGEVLNQLIEKRKEVNTLRNSLNEVNEVKEGFYDEKQKFSVQIKDLISKVKEFQAKRDALTSEVRVLKDKKRALLPELDKKISELRLLNEEKSSLMSKHNIQKTPGQIRKEMEAAEMKIETEVMSFEKENQMMKVIKGLKKKLAEVEEISNVWSKGKDISKDISNLRKDIRAFSLSIQVKAKASQEEHENMLKVSQEIDDIKVKEKEFKDKFLDEKKRFSDINSELNKKLDELKDIKREVDKERDGEREEKLEKVKKTLAEKKKDVDEKLKNGEKLTTQDLLVLQEADDIEEKP